MWHCMYSGLLFAYSRNGSLRFYGTSKHVSVIPGDGSLTEDDMSFNSDDYFKPNHIAQIQK